MRVPVPARPVLLVAALALPVPASAQQTNAAALGALAVECLAPVVQGESVRFEGLDAYPFLRSAVHDAFRAAGVTVWASDAEAGTGPRLSTVAERVETAYEAARRGSIRRTLTLRLRTRMTADDGRVLHDAACERTAQDLVPRALVPALEDPAFPSTRAEPAPSGFVRKVLRPAVAGAATAAGVFLFFSLRSRRASDGS